MTTDRAVLLMKMMANPIRIQILKVLSEKEPGICVGGMEEILNIPQSSVSQHLAHLRNCGILTCEKKGKKVCYKIVETAVIDILKSMKIED
jgi:DNA-binding transcriptional ArsR family regulator